MLKYWPVLSSISLTVTYAVPSLCTVTAVTNEVSTSNTLVFPVDLIAQTSAPPEGLSRPAESVTYAVPSGANTTALAPKGPAKLSTARTISPGAVIFAIVLAADVNASTVTSGSPLAFSALVTI